MPEDKKTITDEKISGDVNGKFTISLDRDADDYVILYSNKKTKTTGWVCSPNAKNLNDILLSAYFNGESSIKSVLGKFIANVVVEEISRSVGEQQMNEKEKSFLDKEISKNTQIN